MPEPATATAEPATAVSEPATAGAEPATILTEAYAGLQAQALGLAEAAGFAAALHAVTPRPPWSWLSARFWPAPLRAVPLPAFPPGPIFAAGGTAAVLAAALRRPSHPAVAIQHPRIDPARFDVVVVNRHDGLTGPNVVVTRTALHRATPARLAAAAAEWAPTFAHLPRPLVAVLLGGSNGRFRFDRPIAAHLAAQLAALMQRDGAGLVLTPSRRTAPEAIAALAATLAPRGAWFWDGAGPNPYFGLLALADAIIVTEDSVSMVSEAAATAAPVLLAPLPGRSRRIRLFNDLLVRDNRARPFTGRLETWPVTPLDDTPIAAAEIRRRLGLEPAPASPPIALAPAAK